MGFIEARGQEQELLGDSGDSGASRGNCLHFSTGSRNYISFFFKLAALSFWIFRLHQHRGMCFSHLDEKLHGQAATSLLLLKSAPAPRLSPAGHAPGQVQQCRREMHLISCMVQGNPVIRKTLTCKQTLSHVAERMHILQFISMVTSLHIMLNTAIMNAA